MNTILWKKFKNSGSYSRQVKKNKQALLSTAGGNKKAKNAKGILQYFDKEPYLNISTEFDSVENDMLTRNNWILELEDISDNDTIEGDNVNVQDELQKWAINFNVTQSSLKALLKILNNKLNANLPNDPRTILLTPTTKEIIFSKIGAGLYWHQGLEFCLKNYFTNITRSRSISVNINIDGLPLFRSSKDEFWPILFNIHEIKDFDPMVIGIYHGKTKPSSAEEYLQIFVAEMKNILEHGIIIGKHKIKVSIRCFICDSPARAFIKGVANFNGQHGCLKCTTIGEYSHISHCNIFPRYDCPLRTDEKFRSKEYELHQKYKSPLEDLPIDMIETFIVADSLHLIHLGIVKRCLLGWRDGSYKRKIKWSANEINKISQLLIQCKMPKEIHRAVRGLECLAYWKGVEYSTFLHYVGIVILKDFLPYNAYEHFLVLFCAVTICSSVQYFHLLHVAKVLFEHYVEKYIEIYGEQYITSNVHNLTHVVNDVNRYGSLPSISSYPFENKLFEIKRLLRMGKLPLSQVARRISEITVKKISKNSTIYPILKKENEGKGIVIKNLPDQTKKFYFEIELRNGFTLNHEMQNKWFLSTDNEIFEMKNAILCDSNYLIYGSSLDCIEDFFTTPIKSSYLNIYVSNCEEKETKLLSLCDIKCKLVALPYKNHTKVFIPLLHTIQ